MLAIARALEPAAATVGGLGRPSAARPPARLSAHRVRACAPGMASGSCTHSAGSLSWGGSVHTRRVSVGSRMRASASADGPDTPDTAAADTYTLLPVLTAVGTACLGALLFGYHLGVVNGPLGEISASLAVSDPFQQGLIVSIALAGAAVGSLGGSGLADSLGRKKSFLLDVLPLAGGAALSAAATNVEMMLLGRFLAGIGIGFSSALVPLYISELAPTRMRGTLGSLNQLLICIGILGALVVNVLLPPTAWRTMFWLAAMPAALLGVGFLLAPESPRWLLEKGRVKEAEANALSLWGPDGLQELRPEEEAPLVDVESVGKMEMEGGNITIMATEVVGGDSIKAVGKMEMEGDSEPPPDEEAVGAWADVLANKKVVAIGCMLFLFQQFSGVNAIVYFSSDVFTQAGVKSATLASAAVGLTNVLGTMVAGALMDKAGRKVLLSGSMTGQALSMLVMAAGFSIPALQPASGMIALVGTIAYILSFALGCGAVPGLVVPEICPSKIRGTAVSMALGTHWVANFLVGQLFLASVDAVGVSGVYFFFSVICLMGVAFVQKFLVETKGRTFSEIAALMERV